MLKSIRLSFSIYKGRRGEEGKRKGGEEERMRGGEEGEKINDWLQSRTTCVCVQREQHQATRRSMERAGKYKGTVAEVCILRTWPSGASGRARELRAIVKHWLAV